jgi:putative flippase GtrA
MSQTNTLGTFTGLSLRARMNGRIAIFAQRFGDRAKEVERFVKFALVGFSGAVVDFGTVIILQATILPPLEGTANVVIATTIAFIAAIINNFLWNRYWTYPDSRTRSVRRQMVQFTIISVIGWLGRTVWIAAAHKPLGEFLMPILLPEIQMIRPGYIPSDTAEGKLGTLFAQLIGVAVVMVWNFLANRYWTYNDVE